MLNFLTLRAPLFLDSNPDELVMGHLKPGFQAGTE